MFTLGIPGRQYRRTTQVLGPENADPIDYETTKQDDGFYVFTFDTDYDSFQNIVILLKNNGITTIGADEQLSERKIMKLKNLLFEQEANLNRDTPSEPRPEPFNRMETTDDIIDRLGQILEEWETKEYQSDQDRWNQYFLDIEELVEDYKENQSIDREDPSIEEQKLRKLIQNIIKEWRK